MKCQSAIQYFIWVVKKLQTGRRFHHFTREPFISGRKMPFPLQGHIYGCASVTELLHHSSAQCYTLAQPGEF